jgi:predicted MPP superfamily phosphohydrolase
MRTGPPVMGILIFLAILLLVDWYVFTGIRPLTAGLEARTRKIIHWSYWIINIGLFAWFILGFFVVGDSGRQAMPRSFMTFMGIWLLFFVPKLIFGVFLLGEDIYRLFHGGYALINNAVSETPMQVGQSRRKFIGLIAAGVAAIPFVGILHGMSRGKFRFTVRREDIWLSDLPEAFDGFTITQLSDIHVGSFDPESDRKAVEEGIALANAQKSDLFVFTGDLVNNTASEMEPWINSFSKLRAPYGQFSILGNHDYGDYVGWESATAKEANMQRLYAIHNEVGFKLMRNEHTVIEKDGQQLFLLGVENWGHGFGQRGDLDKALQQVPENAFKVLLSHDPSHFDHVVSEHKTPVHLTLSGHTHGMQFGIEIPGVKFSPVQFRYPHWAGLYEETRRYLYVNRGFGFLAFPGRVGIWPEVAVLTLRRGKAPATT